MSYKESRKLASRKWARENVPQMKTLQRDYLDRLKIEVLSHYCPSLKCKCGFSDIDCLDIDHTNNDGANDRKIMRVGPVMLRWLKKNNYPKGFQILCRNCNWKKHLVNLRKELKKKYDYKSKRDSR